MKKSEMILKLRTVLKLNHESDCLAYQRGDISLGALADRVIPSILARAEKEGMFPPYNPLGSEPLEGHIMYCQWRPEDAEK